MVIASVVLLLVFIASPARADVQPGDVISKANAEKVKDLVSPGLYWCVEHGLPMRIVAPRKLAWPAAYREATEKYSSQVKLADARHESAVGWRGDRLGGAELLAIKVAAAGAATRRGQQRALQPALATDARLRALFAAHPHDHLLALATSEAALLAGDVECLAGQPSRARSEWSRAQTTLAAIALLTGASTAK